MLSFLLDVSESEKRNQVVRVAQGHFKQKMRRVDERQC